MRRRRIRSAGGIVIRCSLLEVRRLLVVALVTLSVSHARANDDRPRAAANAHFTRGAAHFEARRFEAAVSEFEAAYALDPNRDYLFAWAQAERLGGDCASAVLLYDRFIAAEPPERQKRAATDNRALCEQALATRPQGIGVAGASSAPSGAAASGAATSASPRPPVSDAQVVGVPVTPDRSTEVSVSQPRPDAIGLGLAGAGAVGLGVGTWLFVASERAAGSAQTERVYGDHARAIEAARGQRVASLVSLGAGVALAGGAVARLFWPAAEPGGVAVTMHGTTPMLAWDGRFW